MMLDIIPTGTSLLSGTITVMVVNCPELSSAPSLHYNMTTSLSDCIKTIF